MYQWDKIISMVWTVNHGLTVTKRPTTCIEEWPGDLSYIEIASKTAKSCAVNTAFISCHSSSSSVQHRPKAQHKMSMVNPGWDGFYWVGSVCARAHQWWPFQLSMHYFLTNELYVNKQTLTPFKLARCDFETYLDAPINLLRSLKFRQDTNLTIYPTPPTWVSIHMPSKSRGQQAELARWRFTIQLQTMVDVFQLTSLLNQCSITSS